MELLLKHGADAKAVAYNKYTPLHLAAWSGNAEVIALLLDHGADVKATDCLGKPPLSYASTRAAVDALVKAGGEVNPGTPLPPLLDAAMHGFPEAVEAMLDHGADIQSMDYTHYTPLHYAAWNENAQTAKVLIRRGADVYYRDDWYMTPLQWAEHWGNRQVIDALKDAMAKTPLKKDSRHW